MRKKAIRSDGRAGVDSGLSAGERMAHYRGAHPTSPSAIHCPQLLLREQLWIAVLSENDKKEIVGIGISVEEALRDFDAKYVAQSNPKPPSDPGT